MQALASSLALALLIAPQGTQPRKAAPAPPAYPYQVVPEDAIWGHLAEGYFREPMGVFFEPVAQELYVADSKNGLVGIFNADHASVFAFGGAALLTEPRVVLADPDGTIYVLDVGRTDLRSFSYRGEPRSSLTFVRPAAAEGEPPQPIAVCALTRDTRGLWYVGDLQDHRVRVYDSKLKFVRELAPSDEQKPIRAVSDIAVSSEGLVAVSDPTGSPAIRVFGATGKLLAAWGERDVALGDFTSAAAVAFDELGFLYAVDMLRHDVKVFVPSGQLVSRFGGWASPETRGRGPGEMLYPTDIAIATGGRIYVAERFGHRVQVFERKPLEPKRPPDRRPGTPPAGEK